MELNSYKEAHKQLSDSAAILRMRYNKLVKQVKEVRDKLEVMDYYGVPEAIDDLNKILGDEEE